MKDDDEVLKISGHDFNIVQYSTVKETMNSTTSPIHNDCIMEEENIEKSMTPTFRLPCYEGRGYHLRLFRLRFFLIINIRRRMIITIIMMIMIVLPPLGTILFP